MGSRRLVASTARYRAVSESTAETATDDEDEREADYGPGGGGLGGSGSYESLGTCELILTDTDDARSSRSHPCTGRTCLNYRVSTTPRNLPWKSPLEFY